MLYFNTNKPHSFLFFCLQNTSCIRKPQVISGGGDAHPLHPPPRSAPVLNNGFTTDIFFGKRWVRQGDHFSSLLFILALETLVSQSRENRNIKGFFINGKEFKTTLFHDDMTCFLRDTNSYFRLLKSLKKILPDTQAFV